MKLRYNKKGAERKALVKAMEEILGLQSQYQGVPSLAYQLSIYKIDKEGTVSWIGDEDPDGMIEKLAEWGFVAEGTGDPTPAPEETEGVELTVEDEVPAEEESASEQETFAEPDVVPEDSADKLSISMPRTILDDAGLERLKSLIEAKGTLMKHAFKTEGLSVEVDDEKITFPWFTIGDNPDRSNAYMHFIQAICKMAKEQKRITAKDRDVENEKYAFRCFLLRLGFIGKEYKTTRKILMENLTGSAAFKDGKAKEADGDEFSE